MWGMVYKRIGNSIHPVVDAVEVLGSLVLNGLEVSPGGNKRASWVEGAGGRPFDAFLPSGVMQLLTGGQQTAIDLLRSVNSPTAEHADRNTTAQL